MSSLNRVGCGLSERTYPKWLARSRCLCNSRWVGKTDWHTMQVNWPASERKGKKEKKRFVFLLAIRTFRTKAIKDWPDSWRMLGAKWSVSLGLAASGATVVDSQRAKLVSSINFWTIWRCRRWNGCWVVGWRLLHDAIHVALAPEGAGWAVVELVVLLVGPLLLPPPWKKNRDHHDLSAPAAGKDPKVKGE